MRNGAGVQRSRLRRLKRAREWRPYRTERISPAADIGPRGRVEILNQWTDQLVRVVDELAKDLDDPDVHSS